MPIFTYKCTVCQCTLEKLQKEVMLPKICPDCKGKDTMEKKFSTPVGFIKNDYPDHLKGDNVWSIF